MDGILQNEENMLKDIILFLSKIAILYFEILLQISKLAKLVSSLV
jgi:hypothetical protein